MPKSTYLHEKRNELYLMIAMGSYYEGARKCLINYTNGITEIITTITWMFVVGGISSKGGTVTVPHSVKCNIMD